MKLRKHSLGQLTARANCGWRSSNTLAGEPDRTIRLGTLNHTHAGFVTLTEIYATLKGEIFSNIGLDLSGATWISNCMAAPLAVVLDHISETNAIFLTGLPGKKVHDTLCRCGFLPHFGLPAMNDGYLTSLKLERIPAQQGQRGGTYLRNQLAGRDVFPPGVTKSYQHRLLSSFAEVFSNAEQHADTTNLYACGQFHPKDRILRMSVMDGGRTIPTNVSQFLKEPTTDVEAIEWALGKGNTTTANQYGGNGLSDLRDFITSNVGRLTVVSGHGYWCQAGEEVTTCTLEYPLPGTAFVWEINVRDEQIYESD